MGSILRDRDFDFLDYDAIREESSIHLRKQRMDGRIIAFFQFRHEDWKLVVSKRLPWHSPTGRSVLFSLVLIWKMDSIDFVDLNDFVDIVDFVDIHACRQ